MINQGRVSTMIIATWNLNNRVGNTTFRSEAANAAIALNADVFVLNEYFPQHNEAECCALRSLANYSLLSLDTVHRIGSSSLWADYRSAGVACTGFGDSSLFRHGKHARQQGGDLARDQRLAENIALHFGAALSPKSRKLVIN